MDRWIAAWVVGSVPSRVDVRLEGNRRGFDFSSSFWTGTIAGLLYSSPVESLLDECAQMAMNAGYGELKSEQFFAYVETIRAGEIMKLVRLENAGDDINAKWQSGESIKIRVQTWSDVSCDAGLENGDQPSLIRIRMMND